MADPHRTFGDLQKAKAILEADLDAAVEASMTDPSSTEFVFAGGYSLNHLAAVRGQASAWKPMRDPDSSPASKQAVVRRAILPSKPLKGSAMTDYEAGYL